MTHKGHSNPTVRLGTPVQKKRRHCFLYHPSPYQTFETPLLYPQELTKGFVGGAGKISHSETHLGKS